MSNASDILGINDLRLKQVKVPQWNTSLTIRELGLQESMDAFADVKADDDGNITLKPRQIAQVVAFGVVDNDGERVFSDADIDALARKNRDALMLLYTEIARLCGSVEDEVKN